MNYSTSVAITITTSQILYLIYSYRVIDLLFNRWQRLMVTIVCNLTAITHYTTCTFFAFDNRRMWILLSLGGVCTGGRNSIFPLCYIKMKKERKNKRSSYDGLDEFHFWFFPYIFLLLNYDFIIIFSENIPYSWCIHEDRILVSKFNANGKCRYFFFEKIWTN